MGGTTENIILQTDSYKVSHYKQYPPGTTALWGYFESRGGKFPTTVFFGLQYILKRWLVGPVLNKQMIREAAEFYKLHFVQEVFNEEGWTYIWEKYKGYLPLRVRAVPEGSVIPTKNILFSVESTDPQVPWLTTWFETIFVQVWYPMSVATVSRAQKEIIAKYLYETADSLDGIELKLHDFGCRGATCIEAAGIGGCGHLVNFMGSDTVPALVCARKYYGCQMAGHSLPATEHSTVTAWGRDGEVRAYRNLLARFPSGLVACVSDSYDVYRACENLWGEQLHEAVVARDGSGLLVIRPDSGDPLTVVLKVLEILGSKFGSTKNSKGYKMLPRYIRVLQGDGITHETIGDVLEGLKVNGWSTDNLVFGEGAGLLQKVDRDTQKCAFKISHAMVGGSSVNVYKDPVTDKGKMSKKGKLTLELRGDEYVTVQEGKGDPSKDVLVTVFENGRLLKEYTLQEIRVRAEVALVKRAKVNNAA
ncbi:PREDICTED: nicotinamide phosphoribosyltransferase-like [Priapulus caudatus]|uniref:Nicotinamide phosphoribosyltransferase n=1 Tax=Priapulus caudatus TaxID=37621 RepID=A0ABM1ELQ4_PRICU|nr:PREDICTED: nicotinamide phosphoribosyltransferase-like [Priapulus caudatus]